MAKKKQGGKGGNSSGGGKRKNGRMKKEIKTRQQVENNNNNNNSNNSIHNTSSLMSLKYEREYEETGYQIIVNGSPFKSGEEEEEIITKENLFSDPSLGFVLYNVLSEEECEWLIQQANDEFGFLSSSSSCSLSNPPSPSSLSSSSSTSSLMNNGSSSSSLPSSSSSSSSTSSFLNNESSVDDLLSNQDLHLSSIETSSSSITTTTTTTSTSTNSISSSSSSLHSNSSIMSPPSIMMNPHNNLNMSSTTSSSKLNPFLSYDPHSYTDSCNHAVAMGHQLSEIIFHRVVPFLNPLYIHSKCSPSSSLSSSATSSPSSSSFPSISSSSFPSISSSSSLTSSFSLFPSIPHMLPMSYSPHRNSGEKMGSSSAHSGSQSVPLRLSGAHQNAMDESVVISLSSILGEKKKKKVYPVQVNARVAEGRYEAYGLNPYFRFVRYQSGGYFFPHHEEGFQLSQNELSMKTVIIFLNDGFQGGSVRFFNDHQPLLHPPNPNHLISRFTPKRGSCLVFNHCITHDVESVDGQKWILQSEVMYRKI